MNKQTKLYLGIGAALAAYWLWRNSKKITTASPAADKMKLTCAEGEKLEEGLGGAPRCVPVSEVVSGPQPKFDLSADGTTICPICGRMMPCGCGKLNRFGNPNISGVPTNIVSNFASMAGVDIKANDFFTQKPGGFYR